MKTNCFFLVVLLVSFFSVQAQNKAAYFGAFSKYYRCGNITISGNQLTVEALVKLDGSGPYVTGQSANDIVSKHNGANDANYVLRPDHCEITTSNGHFYSKIDLPAFSKDSFYHVAMTYNGSFMRFYVNGCLFSEVPATGQLITNNYETTIGQLASNPTALGIEQLYGFADEIRIWSVARTQEQIKTNMHQLANPTTQTGLLAYYNFEGNTNNIQGNSSFDAVPFGNPEIKVQEGFKSIRLLSASYTILQPTCNGNDGSIRIDAYGGKSPFKYSLDGVSYQSGNTFSGLSAGDYRVYFKADGGGCIKDTLIRLIQPCQPSFCNTWLSVPSQPSYVRIGDLDVTGNKITVEAMINRTAPWSGSDAFQGDIVSKHEDPTDCNYLLRPSSAEISTTNGYFKTPAICPIELNKTYHVAMVYDGSTLKFYRNGFLMSQVAASGNLAQNNWQAQIGLYFNQITQENFIGYINEVRIWNIARSQADIQSFMTQSLPNPRTTAGLLAYYTFDNLVNKQGNATWNGKLGGSASINKLNPNCDLKIDSCNIQPCTTPLLPDFEFKQDVCNPKAFRFTSSLDNMSFYEWDFDNGEKRSGASSELITFRDYGIYTVQLKVKNNAGCEGIISKNVSVNLQASDIILTADTSICKGESFTLRTAKNVVDYCWSPADGLEISQSNTPTAKPTTTTTYIYTAKAFKDNLIINGDFTNGNTGFQSDYQFSYTGIPEGVYNVGANVQAWHSGLSNCSDRSGGNGNMLMINGSSSKNVKVWYQTITVTPHTNYVFSAWVQSLAPNNPAHLQFSINGNRIGSDLFASTQTCEWERFYNTWNSGSNTKATIAIVNMNQQLVGNDFALDDLFFGEVVILQESIKVTVVEKPIVAIMADTLICEGEQVQLWAAGAQQYSWTPSVSLSASDIPNPVASPAQTTSYHVTALGSNGCLVIDSVRVSIQQKPVFNLLPAINSICKGDSVTLTAIGGDDYKWLPNANLISNGSSAIVFPNENTAFSVFVDNKTCKVSETLQTTVHVKPLPQSSISKSNDIDCANTTTQLVASGGQIYNWFPATGISNVNIANPTASPRQNTTYHVRVSNADGCSVEDSVTVLVTNSGSDNFYVPNAFTPDGNGKNDCFSVKYKGVVDDFHMVIYNRWGEVVFSTKNIANCWDGKYKGVEQQTGVFVYSIKAQTFCGPIEKRGVLTLIR